MAENWKNGYLSRIVIIVAVGLIGTFDSRTVASDGSHFVDDLILESARNSFMMIPDHAKVSEEASEYMTVELYEALAAAWDVPVWDEGDIGNEEFLFYFVTGNGGTTVDSVKSVAVISEEKGRCTIELKYTEGWSDGTLSEEISTISLVMVKEGGRWLLDDFGRGVKEECINYILSELSEFQSGKIRRNMKESQYYTDEDIAEVDGRFNAYMDRYRPYLNLLVSKWPLTRRK